MHERARARRAARGIDPHVETSVLDNGLRVVRVQLPHLRTCTLAFYLRAGPRFERPAENG
jgi:predicted Zn-dependent peptidase